MAAPERAGTVLPTRRGAARSSHPGFHPPVLPAGPPVPTSGLSMLPIARSAARVALFLLAPLTATGCAANRPSQVTPAASAGALVLVKQVRIPVWEPWYARFAVHTWFDVRAVDGTWTRIGVPGTSTDVVRSALSADEATDDLRWERPVRVLDVVRGERAEHVARQLDDAEDLWTDGSYEAFPGPNSNTFVERVVRSTDGLSTQLAPNATGADWAPLRVGRTGGGTGVELESAWFGLELGLREGVELHLAQLPIGVRLWPPALVLPFLPALGPRWEP